MSHNGNWFAVSRMIFDHPVVGIHDREFTELEAWLWLLAEAAFEPQKVNNMGDVIMLDCGQIMHARRYLSVRWQWTEDKVRWFLKKLTLQAMITKHTQQVTGKKSNKIQIITISNYGQYQFSQTNQEAAQSTAQPPANTQPAPSQHPKANNSTLDSNNPPSPLPGGDPVVAYEALAAASQKAKAEKAAATKAANEQAREAFAIYNKAAAQFGFRNCETITKGRLSRMVKRLADIGGVGKFREALWAVVKNDFLMGRVQQGGREPFKLDIDRLLQTDGKMGDVLANLLDRASEIHKGGGGSLRPDWWREIGDSARRMPADWWLRMIAKHANGRWPVEFLGPGPWDRDGCLVPEAVRVQLGLAAKYPTSDGRCADPHH